MRHASAMAALILLGSCGGGSGLAAVRFDVAGEAVTVEAEIADTPEQQARGLMGRKSLPRDRGMLFVWDVPAPRQFYMFRTLIPLDVIAIRAGRVVGVSRLEPCQATDPADCPRTNIGDADAALEVNAGVAAELGIVRGVRVSSERLN